MTAAPFIAFAFGSGAEAGPLVCDPGTAELQAEVGFAGALPTVLIGGRAAVSPRVDLGARAVTHAGLAYAFGGAVRWAASERIGAALLVDESFYTVEEIGGIQSLRSPFGNRVALTPQLIGAVTTGRGIDLDLGGGAEIGVLRLEQGPAATVRRVRPALDNLWAEVRADWPRERGVLYVRVRAIVPVADPFHVLGYLPWVAIGREWGLR